MSRLTTDSQIKKDLQKNNRTMEVTRIIHPVGQGGFYTETLSNGTEEATFVYDCGGFDKGKKKMTDYLDSFLHSENAIKNPGDFGKKKIEAVFISHFHADHINGLQYLLDNAEVKYLFLPQLTEDILLEAFVYNYCLTGTYNYTNRFLMNLYRGNAKYGMGDNSTKIIPIDTTNDNGIPENFNAENFSDEGFTIKAWDFNQKNDLELVSLKSISPNLILHYGQWLFIPFNPKVASDKVIALKERLVKKTGGRIEIKTLSTLLKSIGVKECKKIYTEVFGKQHNSYSMTLLSGTLEHVRRSHCKKIPDCQDIHPLCDDSFFHPCCYNPNILYTGDFEPANNIKELQRYYSVFWKEIATIQIPHHGSINNYDEGLYKHPIRGVVSVGNENTYHHPDIETLVKIQNQGCHPVIVTEDKSSMKIYHYSF